MFAPLAQPGTAYASSVTSAGFTGGTGTVSVGGTLYAKQGAALTLTIVHQQRHQVHQRSPGRVHWRPHVVDRQDQLDIHHDGAYR
jgi:hypothetical protein